MTNEAEKSQDNFVPLKHKPRLYEMLNNPQQPKPEPLIEPYQFSAEPEVVEKQTFEPYVFHEPNYPYYEAIRPQPSSKPFIAQPQFEYESGTSTYTSFSSPYFSYHFDNGQVIIFLQQPCH